MTMTRVIGEYGTYAATGERVPAFVPQAGMRLGRYELVKSIAAGGMAEVWAAEQRGELGFRKLVALKMVRTDLMFNPTFRAMFLDEARVTSLIRHPNVVEMLDLGIEGPVVYQALTLVDGLSLGEWSGRAEGFRRPAGATLRIAIDMLSGLHAAHEVQDEDGIPLGLVHRDVSSQNVLVGADGVTRLADFGIAKWYGRREHETGVRVRRMAEETRFGRVKGKPGYMAPEIRYGEKATRASDVFSAGVVLWELLTGKTLLERDQPEQRGVVVRDPRTVVPSISPMLATITLRALERDQALRYQTAHEMASALEVAAKLLRVDVTHRHVAAVLDGSIGGLVRANKVNLNVARKRAA
jgi:serine/threonine-protein kinase